MHSKYLPKKKKKKEGEKRERNTPSHNTAQSREPWVSPNDHMNGSMCMCCGSLSLPSIKGILFHISLAWKIKIPLNVS